MAAVDTAAVAGMADMAAVDTAAVAGMAVADMAAAGTAVVDMAAVAGTAVVGTVPAHHSESDCPCQINCYCPYISSDIPISGTVNKYVNVP